MKLYISGPITGTEDYMERFVAAQKELEEEGWSVVNPALVNSNLPEDTEWEDYMRMAVCMLDMCEVVYFLDGWEKSRGANIEYGYAQAKGKDIMFQKEEQAGINRYFKRECLLPEGTVSECISESMKDH